MPAQNSSFVKLLQAGDNGAWDQFMMEYRDLIQSIVSWSKWHFSPDVRDEIAQKIRSEIPKSIAGLREESQLQAFVKRICINRCIDEVRRQAREGAILVPLAVRNTDGDWEERDIRAGEEFDPVRMIVLKERASALKTALEKLEPACRTVFRQFYVENLPYRDIARQQSIDIKTVGSRLSRCLEKMRKLISGDEALKAGITPA